MFGYFWSRNATLGMAALYLVLGIVLLLFPGMSGTVFCWGLAAGAGLYAAGNFWRWHQGKKQGYSLPGLLLAGLLAAVLCLVCIFRPQFILSFLPLVLGALLLVDALGKIPLTIGAIELDSPAMIPLAMSCFFPALLGILLRVNPFSAVHVVIRLFGIVLLITGIIELIATVISHRTAEAVSSEIDHL